MAKAPPPCYNAILNVRSAEQIKINSTDALRCALLQGLFRAAQGNGDSLQLQQTTRTGQSCHAKTPRYNNLHWKSPPLMSSVHHCNCTTQAKSAVQLSSWQSKIHLQTIQISSFQTKQRYRYKLSRFCHFTLDCGHSLYCISQTSLHNTTPTNTHMKASTITLQHQPGPTSKISRSPEESTLWQQLTNTHCPRQSQMQQCLVRS